MLLATAAAGTRVKRKSKAAAAVETHVKDVSIRDAVDRRTTKQHLFLGAPRTVLLEAGERDVG